MPFWAQDNARDKLTMKRQRAIDNVLFEGVNQGAHSVFCRFDSDQELPLVLIYMNGAKATQVIVKKDYSVIIPPFSVLMARPDSEMKICVPESGSGIELYCRGVENLSSIEIGQSQSAVFQGVENTVSVVQMETALKDFFISASDSLGRLVREPHFAKVKSIELFHLLQKQIVSSGYSEFMTPASTSYDIGFRHKVFSSYPNSYRVKSIAADCGYPIKAFTKKFKDEFHMLPKEWINERIMESIREYLAIPEMEFKDIAEELKMSSVQNFSRFCKAQFGKTPTELRNELLKQGS